jgi:hypothetical protein
MDIICLTCDMHFESAEGAKEHKCRGKPIYQANTTQVKTNGSNIPGQVVTSIIFPSTQMQICPTCKKPSLMLNEISNRYECLNLECKTSFFRVTVDKNRQLITAEKEALDELSTKETRAWFGNQYYDAKRKKWRDGEKPIRVRWTHNYWNWIFIVLAFVFISLAVTLILNYFWPGTRFTIFGW